MTWYRTGTVSVTNGSTTVTGSSTAFVANVRAGYGFRGPDGKTYEIASANSDTSLTLAESYTGSTASGQSYAIFPTQSVIADLATSAQSLMSSFTTVRDGVGAGLHADGSATTPAIRFSNDQDTGFYRVGNNSIGFATNGTFRGGIDGSGNLVVGTASTTFRAQLHATSVLATSNANVLKLSQAGDGGLNVLFSNSVSDLAQIAVNVASTGAGTNDGIFAIQTALNGSLSERMRVTSTGEVLVNTTTAGAGAGVTTQLAVDAGTGHASVFKSGTSSSIPIRAWNATTTGDGAFISFATETSLTVRGSVSYNRAGGLTAYNTTSDYRAKEVIGPIGDPGAVIDALNVFEGQMIGADVSRPMMFAHEVQAVAPYAVTGEFDAVDEDGAPILQQMDVSALVPLLIAEVQALRSRVAMLEPTAP